MDKTEEYKDDVLDLNDQDTTERQNEDGGSINQQSVMTGTKIWEDDRDNCDTWDDMDIDGKKSKSS